MSEEKEEEQEPIGIILFIIFFWILALRPEEGYMRMIEYMIQSPEDITFL